MRKIAITLAATLALGLTPVLTAAPAQADTPRCVTKQEFRKVDRGWRITRVHRLFDAKGHLTFQSGGYKSREYKACVEPRYSYVSVDYHHGRVNGKTAFWG